MKNRPIVALLTVIAILLGANLVVATASTSWAQVSRDQEQRDRTPQRPQIPSDRQPVRPQIPGDRERPQIPGDRERPVRPGAPQRPARCVGITTVGNVIVLAFDDGTVETRHVPAPQ